MQTVRSTVDVLRDARRPYVTLNLLTYGLVAATLLIAALYEVALVLLVLPAPAG